MIEMYFLFFTFILSIYGMETWAYVVATTLEKKTLFPFSMVLCFPFSVYMFPIFFILWPVFYIQFSLSLSFYLIFTSFCCFSFTFLFQSFSFRFFSIVSHILPFLSIFIHMLSSATLLLFVQYCSCVCVRVVRVWINPFKMN